MKSRNLINREKSRLFPNSILPKLVIFAFLLGYLLPASKALAQGGCVPVWLVSKSGFGTSSKCGFEENTNSDTGWTDWPEIKIYRVSTDVTTTVYNYNGALDSNTASTATEIVTSINTWSTNTGICDYTTTNSWQYLPDSPTLTTVSGNVQYDLDHSFPPTTNTNGTIYASPTVTVEWGHTTGSAGGENISILETNINTLSDEYTTSQVESEAASRAAVSLATATWTTNMGSASASSFLDLSQAVASRTQARYHFQFDTEKDKRYKLTWLVHTRDVESYTSPEVFHNEGDNQMSWMVDGTGDLVNSPDYDLATGWPSAPYDTSYTWTSDASIEIIPINSGGGGPSGGCGACKGKSASPGSAFDGPSIRTGPNLNLSLGDSAAGYGIGSMLINPTTPIVATPSLVSLQAMASDLSTIPSGSDISQTMGSQILVNIVSNTASQFDINIYDTNNFSTTLVSGKYPFTTNGQTVTWRIENPGGASDTNTLRIIETRSGHSITNLFTWQTNGVTLVAGSGLKKEVWQTAWDASFTTRTETFEIRDTNDVQFYVKTNIFTAASGWDQLTTSVEGSGSHARTNTFSYNSDGSLAGITRFDGSSESYSYDSMGRLAEKDWANHSAKYYYMPLGGADDGSFQPNVVRTVTNFFNSQPVSVHYSVLTPTNRIEIDAANLNVWTDSAHLRTTNIFDTNSRPISIANPDGTMQWFTYNISPFGQTNTVSSGYATGPTTFITNKVQVTKLGMNGRLQSTSMTEDGILTDQTIYTNYDSLGRVGAVVYFDQTSEGYQYDCCGLSSMTNRDGMTTVYSRDDLKRVYSKANYDVPGTITWISTFDPAGRVVATARQGGTNTITINTATYDNAGRQLTSADALSHTNSFGETLDTGSMHYIRTTTNADAGTVIQEYDSDGFLLKRTGTAVHPARFVESTALDGSVYVPYIQEIKLDASGTDTSETVTKYSDLLGRNYKTVYADGAAATNFYNGVGQLSGRSDPDGVTTFFRYNVKGEQTTNVVDVNQNGSVDWSGPDRITFTTNDVAADNGTNVYRTRTFVWSVNSNVSNLVSTVERSVEGLKSWNIVWNNGVGMTSVVQTVYGTSGFRYVTNTAPGSSYSVSTYQYGRLLSVVRKDASNSQTGQTAYGYDAHGRQSTMTDARNGTITYGYDLDDRMTSTTTPNPGTVGGAPETAYSFYDSVGRVLGTLQPDNTTVTNLYYPTGLLKQTRGSRTYPVGYGYDAQGRMTTMTNWTSFAGNTGTRVTTWNYDTYRGFLSSKVYDDGKGPAYTYTAAGRLLTRLWARGTNTTYAYTGAGDLSTTIYNDGVTLGITNGYDRLGRLTTISNGPSVCTLTYNDANQVLSESYSGGPLDNYSITNGYDALLRRTNNVMSHSGTVLTVTTNSFDAALLC